MIELFQVTVDCRQLPLVDPLVVLPELPEVPFPGIAAPPELCVLTVVPEVESEDEVEGEPVVEEPEDGVEGEPLVDELELAVPEGVELVEEVDGVLELALEELPAADEAGEEWVLAEWLFPAREPVAPDLVWEGSEDPAGWIVTEPSVG